MKKMDDNTTYGFVKPGSEILKVFKENFDFTLSNNFKL